MKLQILDSKKIGHRSWYLSKCNLLEYLENLKDDFYDYAIQRKIVKNQYLDKLYTTIKSGDPIPTITLTYNKSDLDNKYKNSADINLDNSEILDGLQRSFRLWAYLKIYNEFEKLEGINYRDFAKALKLKNPIFFDSGVISTKLIRYLIESNEIKNIKKVLSNYEIYLTIWTGLSEKEVTQKMLVLNAGQKSVSKTHQFELLFLHFFETIRASGIEIKLYREKDSEANDIKRGNRELGQFMFSSVIVSLQSFVEGKPLRISTEKLIEHEFSDEKETSEQTIDLVFNTDFMLYFLTKLVALDKEISSEEGGKEWFSKDTTLSGVFAAIGSRLNFEQIQSSDDLKNKANVEFEKLEKNIKSQSYKLSHFTDQYNVLSSRSVNIGSFIRKVVMEYTIQLIEEKNQSWSDIFNKVKEKK
tara:strand:+ start:18330 stop:19574 length:1245 start_codon:yes stop_codon:yes gene_type:complete